MERESKQKLGWFFDQWLRRPGYPEVTAQWSYDAAAHEVVVDVTQGQRFGAFEFPLTVAAIDSSGVAHRGTTRMAARAGAGQQLRIAVSARPMSLILDPDVELLASLTVIPR